MLGHGWYAEVSAPLQPLLSLCSGTLRCAPCVQPSVNVGPRQLLALVSLTTADGSTAYFPSALASSARGGASAPAPLTFIAAKGPVIADNIYIGEDAHARP